jgi:hypothetical protein
MTGALEAVSARVLGVAVAPATADFGLAAMVLRTAGGQGSGEGPTGSIGRPQRRIIGMYWPMTVPVGRTNRTGVSDIIRYGSSAAMPIAWTM